MRANRSACSAVRVTSPSPRHHHGPLAESTRLALHRDGPIVLFDGRRTPAHLGWRTTGHEREVADAGTGLSRGATHLPNDARRRRGDRVRVRAPGGATNVAAAGPTGRRRRPDGGRGPTGPPPPAKA